MEESVVATRSQPLARITICIHASPRHVSWHACYTCIGRMYVSQGGNVFRKGAKPFRNCFPSLLAPRKTRQPAHPRHEPLIYVSYETCANQVSPSTLHSIISLDPLSTDISPPPPPSTFLLLSEEKLRSKRNIKSDCPIAACPLVLETILFLGKETRNSLDSFGFAGTRGGETRLWKIIIGRGGGGSFRTA